MIKKWENPDEIKNAINKTQIGTPVREKSFEAGDGPVREGIRDYSAGTVSPSVPKVNVKREVPKANVQKSYNPDTDYSVLKSDAEARGDYASAARYEKLRNAKIGDMGLGYGVTDDYNYLDTYHGDSMRAAKAIEAYKEKGFSYDYESDPRYIKLLENQKKEAEEYYQNGLAELSRRFDGDIPSAMVAQLLSGKQEIIDKADSYIPQLWQMAQDMHISEGNRLYDDYNLAENRRNTDYNRWLGERVFLLQGLENAENRNRYNSEWDEGIRRYEEGKQFDREKYEESKHQYNDSSDFAREQFEYQKQRDLQGDYEQRMKLAFDLYKNGYAASVDEAFRKVDAYLGYISGYGNDEKSVASFKENPRATNKVQTEGEEPKKEDKVVANGVIYFDDENGKLKYAWD